jgi:hypothetical protein
MRSYDKEAFFAVCQDAVPATRSYVSLYADQSYYGGPEEGGWWGHDQVLVAYYLCLTDVEAEAVRAAVEKLAGQMSKDAKDDFNRGCKAECEWVEQHDPMADVSDYYPEVGGEVRYWVATEDRPGSLASEGSRHYA